MPMPSSRRQFIASLTLTVLLSSGARADESKPVSSLPSDTRTWSMDNGVRVVVLPLDSPGLVSVQTWMDVGSGDEVEKGTTGYAHFFEHLMFHGTERWSRSDREVRLLELGFEENAWTNLDDTCYHLLGASDGLAEVLDIESDRFANLTLVDAEVRREAGAVYGEFRKGRAVPDEVLGEALWAEAFNRHPYGHSTIGIEADIEAMPDGIDIARRFHQTYYRPDRALLVIAGDVDLDTIEATVDKTFGAWELGARPSPGAVPVEPEQRRARRVTVDWDGAPVDDRFWVAWRVPGDDPISKDTITAALVRALLTAKIAPLYQRLVIDEQLAWSVSSPSWGHADPGLFELHALARPGADLALIEGVVNEVVSSLSEVSEETITLERSRLRREWLLRTAGPEALAFAVGEAVRRSGTIDALDQALEILETIDAATVVAFVDTYFSESGRTTAILRGGGDP